MKRKELKSLIYLGGRGKYIVQDGKAYQRYESEEQAKRISKIRKAFGHKKVRVYSL